MLHISQHIIRHFLYKSVIKWHIEIYWTMIIYQFRLSLATYLLEISNAQIQEAGGSVGKEANLQSSIALKLPFLSTM